MPRGCPECEVTILYSECLDEINEELAALAEKKQFALPGRGREFKWPWTREKLINDVGAVSSMNARVDGKGYRSDWPVHIKNLVQILRQEQALQDRIVRDDAIREAKRNVNGGRDRE